MSEYKLREIVEYRHLAPVRVPDDDVVPEAMHEVIRRLEAIIDPQRGVLSADVSKDVCRLLASRHREWLRADRAECGRCAAYVEGRNDAYRAIQADWWDRRAQEWREEYTRRLVLGSGTAAAAGNEAADRERLAALISDAAAREVRP